MKFGRVKSLYYDIIVNDLKCAQLTQNLVVLLFYSLHLIIYPVVLLIVCNFSSFVIISILQRLFFQYFSHFPTDR